MSILCIYIIEILGILTEVEVLIGSVAYENMFLDLKHSEKLGFLEIKNDEIEKDNPGLVRIFKDGDVYLIKFSNGKFLHMKNMSHELELKNMVYDKDLQLDPEFGFKFDFIPVDKGLLISARGHCLEITGGPKRENTVVGKICKPENKDQWFYIKLPKRIESDILKEKEKLDKKFINEQHEGPTINPIFHGTNSKRDPYMYGNEPFRGRH